MQDKRQMAGKGMAVGTLSGVVVGAVISALTGDWAFWMGIGVAVGVAGGLAVGAGLSERSRRG